VMVFMAVLMFVLVMVLMFMMMFMFMFFPVMAMLAAHILRLRFFFHLFGSENSLSPDWFLYSHRCSMPVPIMVRTWSSARE